METPRIAGIYTALKAGAPITSHATVDLVPGAGIPGDRYATGRGHWSDPKWPDQELTLFEAEIAEALGMDAHLLRRNIVTRGVRLDDLIGARVRVGDAVIEGVRPCDPCRYIELLLDRPGLLKALTARGGLRARVVSGGRISVGDGIHLLPAQ